MLKLRDLKILHLEPTDVCQAACPLCARETNGAFDKNQRHHLTVQQVLKCIDEDQISVLDKMFMCGDYGDPAAGRHTLTLFKKFRQINNNIVLGMNSNGALRTPAWWRELAGVLNQPRDYVVFSIDGLEDTNHIYRKNVDWAKLMSNVQSYISAGGIAHWDMLVYRHNEHQVDQCQQLAKDLGFRWFRAKVSRRPLIDNLQAPVHWTVPTVKNGPIECAALRDQSMYINAQGKPSPCCWLGADLKNKITDVDQVQASWNSADPHPVCKKICSTNSGNLFVDQWQREVEL